MRVVATTVVRESLRGKQETGWIYDVDLDTGTVVHKVPVPDPQFPNSDDNPRGGVRGGRGVAATDKGIVVANYDTLTTFDDEWNVLDSLTHPLFVGLHEIDWDGANLWLAATGLDALLRVDAQGEVHVGWDPHESPLRGPYGLRGRPAPLDGDIDYRQPGTPRIDQLHLNGVAVHNGSAVVNCGLVRRRRSAVRRYWRRVQAKLGGGAQRREHGRFAARSFVAAVGNGGRPEILLELEHNDFPSHNGQLLPDGRVAVNDSTRNRLRIFAGGEAVTDIDVGGTWLRGLEPIGSQRLLVGTAPAAIVTVDLEARHVEGKVQLSDDPHEAVHGLCVVRDRGSGAR